MDKRTAKAMAARLRGTTVGGWLVGEYVNNGKSAVVVLASKGDKVAALKVFDPELVAQYGRDAQRKRIEREKALIGKSHPNLIQVLDGGEDGDYLFVVLEYFDGRNLAEVLKDVPYLRGPITAFANRVGSEVPGGTRPSRTETSSQRTLASPRNMKTAKVLDLGVIRPFDLSNITDEGQQRYFVGTLQVQPARAAFPRGEPSLEGWRAITFYQLGAILHDLLMRKPLFEEFKNPYGCLVRAVEREIPHIDAPEVDPGLRLLAQNCLAKSPSHRLATVKWEDFSEPKVADPLDAARRRIAQHRTSALQAAEAPARAEDLINAQIFTLSTAIFSAVVNTIKAESLPRYSTQTILQPHPYLLRVLFEPAARSGLTCYFGVYCQGTVLDPEASLHELRICACASPTREAVPAEPDKSAVPLVVRGALIEQDVRLHVEQCCGALRCFVEREI